MIIYGKNPIEEALNYDRKIYEVYTSLSQNDVLIKKALSRGIKVTFLDKKTMNKRFDGAHQGVGANVHDYEYTLLVDALEKPGRKLFLMLD
jgi:tRNA G18 (ribose-2'-O)-methylase SpoU